MTALRRILVAVDASPLSVAALEAAARLAVHNEAVLEALFIEDIDLVHAAAHPFVHTVSPWAARREALDEALIDRALRLQAVAARRALDRTLAGLRLEGAFAIRRGRVAAELLAAAGESDLVCLGWSGRAEPGTRPRLGSVARAVAAAADRPVMVLRRAGSGGPVALWWDGSDAARRALAVAAGLASRAGGEVLLARSRHDPAEAVQWLSEQGLAARSLSGPPPADAVLVVPTGSGLALDQAPCSVLVVR